jgi:hypothetical protein
VTVMQIMQLPQRSEDLVLGVVVILVLALLPSEASTANRTNSAPRAESSRLNPGLIGGPQNRRLLFAGIRALDLGIENRSPGRAPTQPILKRSIFGK